MLVKIKKIIPIICVLCFAIISTACKQTKVVTNFEAMNTFMSIQSYGSKANKAHLEIKNRITELENKLSTTKNISTIYKLNHFSGKTETKTFQLDDDVYNLIQFSLNMADQTGGALNISLYPIIKLWGFTTGEYKIPAYEEIQQILPYTDYKKIILQNNVIELPVEMEIDLGAIGKGYAGDEAIKILKTNGITSALLDLGGNIQALGTKSDGSDWTIGIKNPWDKSVAASLKINNQAVITSGGYERFFEGADNKKYIHIFDSKTGYPVENEIESVTIITESGMYGDALSTSLFVMGADGAMDFWKKNRNFEMIILTKEKQLIYTSGLNNKISPLFNFSETIVID